MGQCHEIRNDFNWEEQHLGFGWLTSRPKNHCHKVDFQIADSSLWDHYKIEVQLVAKGFQQHKRKYFEDTFAPIARYNICKQWQL
jgi:hypothetical protein